MRKRIFTVMAALCGLCVLPAAADKTVTADAGYTGLKTVIEEASGEIVRVQVGLYIDSEIKGEINVPAGVTVIGGFKDGFEDENRIYPGAATSKEEMTILDGNASHRVAAVDGTLEGVVIRNGHVRNANGGGVVISNSGTVQNCIIKGNVAMNVGGEEDALGGGVFLNSSEAKLINCVVAFNMANNGYGVAGTGQVINNTITANTYAPVAVAIAGNVGGTPFQHYVHWRDADNAWSVEDGYDPQELYFNNFRIAQTQTTTSQYAVFAAAMDLKVEDASVLFADDVKGTDKLFKVDATYGLHLSGMDYIYKEGNANWPMSCVSWHGAKAYCAWIGGALPTEGQWEYAARMNADNSINTMAYAGSDDAKEVACYAGYPGGMQEVATKMANGIGLYDMSGNVWEWCEDLYATQTVLDKTHYPAYENTIDPVNTTTGNDRVWRGGSYRNASGMLSLAYRFNYVASAMSVDLGFRPLLLPADND